MFFTDFDINTYEGPASDRESESVLIFKKNYFAQWVKNQFFEILR